MTESFKIEKTAIDAVKKKKQHDNPHHMLLTPFK